MTRPDGRRNPDSARAWQRFADEWRDVWTAPVIAAAMAVVWVGTFSTLASGQEPTALAWMNGIAAVVTSVAALAEARRGRALSRCQERT